MKMPKWVIGVFIICLVGLILALAWGHGQIRGLDAQLQAATQAIIELRADNARLSNKLSELVQISQELKRMPLYNLPIKQTLGVADIIRSKAAQYRGIGLTPGLILAVIHIESAGDKQAASHADCYGLMQLLPTTAIPILDRMGFNVAYGDNIKELLFVPTVNVCCGVQELARLRTLHLSQGIDSWHVTLMAYLYGPNGISGLFYSQSIIQRREEMRGRGII